MTLSLSRVLAALRRRLGGEHGFALLYVLGAMVAIFALSAAALAVVAEDGPGQTVDANEKEAYSAAQAGIQRYLFELNSDNTYWTQCVPQSQLQNPSQEWIYNTGQAETNPQPVPGPVPGTYAVMLLPAAGQNTYTKCSTADPIDSMISTSGTNAGTLRIASTGYVGTVKRTIVAAIRQQNFLDYAYFTVYETSDPTVQVAEAYASTGDSDTAIEPPDECSPGTCGADYYKALSGINTPYPGATKQCSQFRYDGRDDQPFYADRYGQFYCTDIEFIGGDQINGPFHSDDSVLICHSPSFGQAGHNDSVEFGGDSNNPSGYVQNCAPGKPVINGTLTAPDNTAMGMPNIVSLAKVAGITYTGTTCLDFTAGGIEVAQPSASQSCATLNSYTKTIPYSTLAADGGVLYVKSGACDYIYDVDRPVYSGDTGCGTVYVKGTDDGQVTIGADQDIVIDGDLTYGSTGAMLGLIANGFIRVYHPVVGGVCTIQGADNAPGYTPITQIDAAMLSLQHSFIVDDYGCGANLGTLNIDGAIAQNFRGVVGEGNSGYTKDYVYDRRLQYEIPPHFLAPTNAGYEIVHQTECDVASCDGTS